MNNLPKSKSITRVMFFDMFNSPVVQVKDICEYFMDMKYETAKQKIRSHQFPVPAFQSHEVPPQPDGDNAKKVNLGTRAPWFVHVDDLAEFYDRKRSEAKKEWESIYGSFH